MSGPQTLPSAIKMAIAQPYKALQYSINQRSRVRAGISITAGNRLRIGRDILNYDFDLIVILDTCRVDALQQVSNEFEFLPDSINWAISAGGATPEWVANTFTANHHHCWQKVGYVTANVWSHRTLVRRQLPEHQTRVAWAPVDFNMVKHDQLAFFDCLYDPPDPMPGTEARAPASIVTDQAIHQWRHRLESNCDQMVVHYVQPHVPYAENAKKEEREHLEEFEKNPDSFLRSGGDKEQVWEAYLGSLRTGLQEVGRLLENADASKVLITADHGEAFGEYGVYLHPIGSFHPKVRLVPWVCVDAEDKNTSEGGRLTASEYREMEDHLAELGYKDGHLT